MTCDCKGTQHVVCLPAARFNRLLPASASRGGSPARRRAKDPGPSFCDCRGTRHLVCSETLGAALSAGGGRVPGGASAELFD